MRPADRTSSEALEVHDAALDHRLNRCSLWGGCSSYHQAATLGRWETLEPEVRDWLESLSDSDFRRVDEVCGLLAEKGSELGGP
jgi:hypothetical protein